MTSEREQFISKDDEELDRVRKRKLRELKRRKESAHQMSGIPILVADSNFNEMINEHQLCLIDCWASWCAPCTMLAPTIEELSKEFAGKIFVGKMNVDENPQIAERFKIFSIPTLLIMKDGDEVDRIVGLVPKDTIKARLGKHME